ncbi:hypothetical protein SS08_15440 [Enterobacter hormaechei subsp. steigerwaltii]|nr:hypothetical protein LI62_06235 [Enterobacter hormaechei subsp. steigerwaltii]KJO28670.1 hypothetical protein SS08_15440 [Enterobacter hormaechei subsp. steigerwaltii]
MLEFKPIKKIDNAIDSADETTLPKLDDIKIKTIEMMNPKEIKDLAIIGGFLTMDTKINEVAYNNINKTNI